MKSEGQNGEGTCSKPIILTGQNNMQNHAFFCVIENESIHIRTSKS